MGGRTDSERLGFVCGLRLLKKRPPFMQKEVGEEFDHMSGLFGQRRSRGGALPHAGRRRV